MSQAQSSTVRHTYERIVPAGIEDVWRAVTDPDDVQQYYYDSVVESSWMPGAELRYVDADSGDAVIEGTVLEVDEPHRLVHSFAFTAAADPQAAKDAPTTVTWTMETEDEGTRVTLEHAGFVGQTATWRTVEDGWDQILDGLVVLFDDGEE